MDYDPGCRNTSQTRVCKTVSDCVFRKPIARMIYVITDSN